MVLKQASHGPMFRRDAYLRVSPLLKSLVYLYQCLSEFIHENQLALGIVINQADQLEWLTDKIIQIPVGYL